MNIIVEHISSDIQLLTIYTWEKYYPSKDKEGLIIRKK